MKVSNLTFDNVHISAKTGMRIFHAEGVTFSNGSAVKSQSGAVLTTYDASASGATTTAY